MTAPITLLAAGAVGYALGNVPSAAVATRLARSQVDINTGGSGNPGAFNTATLLGRRWHGGRRR